MQFGSDNWAGAHPAIVRALTAAAEGHAPAYGASPLDRAVERRFSAIFEREVAVFFVGTGTAANALAMAAASRPGGVAFCHREAHMIDDECGAPEFLSGGRLHGVDGPRGRIDGAALAAAIDRYPPDFVHAGQPMAVSITQATEAGTVYDLPAIAALAATARAAGVPLHMDGARFANALVTLGCTPAEMTWKAGVDILSFGGTKNGCWMAEALVFMDPAAARQAPFLRKRAAQLFSKSRFIAAQFEAYFEDGLWLRTAAHANAMASRLAGALAAAPRARLAWPPQANEVFAILPAAEAERLRAAGVGFHEWHPPHHHSAVLGDGEGLYRFVTSFATTAEEIERFSALLG